MRFPFFVNWDFTTAAWGSTPFTVSQFRAKLNERMRLLFPNSMGVGVHTFRILTNVKHCDGGTSAFRIFYC